MFARVFRADAWPIDIPLARPLRVAGVVQEVAHNVFVRIELTDGTVGYGEAAARATFDGETQEDVLASLKLASTAMIGRDVEGWAHSKGEADEPIRARGRRSAPSRWPSARRHRSAQPRDKQTTTLARCMPSCVPR